MTLPSGLDIRSSNLYPPLPTFGPTLLRSLLLLCLLSGCAEPDTGPDKLIEYLKRLERVTGISMPPQTPFPRALDLPLAPFPTPPESNQINLIDFLSLSGCELQINLGHRNTQLGRTASPSQKLLLALEFIQLAPACSALLRERGNLELATTLDLASRGHQRALPLSIANAILMGPEWKAFWERPKALAHYPATTSSQIVAALGQLTALYSQWLATQSLTDDWATSSREFELLLSQLRAGDGGELIMAFSIVARDMARATAMLIKMNETAPLCPLGQLTERSKAFENIVSRFFVGDIQPWLVALRQRRELLLPPVQQLERPLLAVIPDQYGQWADERDQLLSGHTTLIKRHISAIQIALSGCTRHSLPRGSKPASAARTSQAIAKAAPHRKLKSLSSTQPVAQAPTPVELSRSNPAR